MRTYSVGLVPGPVSVPEEFRRAYLENYGSADLEEDFSSSTKKMNGCFSRC